MSLITSLEAFWKLDEVSGNAADAHDSNTLTANNSPSSGSGIVYSTAREFLSGSSQFFNITDNTSLSMADEDFTLGVWVWQGVKNAQNEHIMDKLNGSDNGYSIFWSNTADRFRMWVNNNFAEWGSAPSTATWYFILGWHDSVNNLIGISVNDGTPVTTSYSGGSTDTTTDLCLGKYSPSAAGFWHGYMGPAFIYRRMLTSGERTQLYNGGSGMTYAAMAATSDAGGGAFGGMFPIKNRVNIRPRRFIPGIAR